MASFERFLDAAGAERPRVLDLGGQPEIWRFVQRPLQIVILNLPGVARKIADGPHCIEYIEGDACDLSRFANDEFDVVFSNSVIEHLGIQENIIRFCNEARRVGRRIWIQTPSKYFPIEPHTGMPFWWWYPAGMKSWLIKRWRKKLPAWTEMILSTTYVQKATLQDLVPGSVVLVETFFGMPKSYIAVLNKTAPVAGIASQPTTPR